MIKLSVIVPMHDSEKYLSRCLKSIFTAVALSKVTAEILLIDNNSTDGTLKKAEEFAKKAPLEIRIFKCEAPGAAAARNFGVLKARGEYIWFIDADDKIAAKSISLLISEAERQKADLTMMGAKRMFPGGKADYLSAVTPEETNYKSRFVRYGAGPWQFLIRREWYVSHGFLFKEGIIHEDMEMISSLILYTDKFAAVNRPLYFYYQNPESVLHKSEWDPHYLDIFTALAGLYTRFQEAKAEEKYHAELEWFFIWNLLIDSAKDFSRAPEGRVGFKKTRKMLKKYFPKWRRNKFLKEKPLKLRIKVRVNYYKI